MVNYTKNTRLAYSTSTQVEFDNTFMASVTRAMSSLELSKVKDIDMVECFYQALSFNLEGFDTKGKVYAQAALTHNYEYVSNLAQTVSKELKIQISDNSHRAKVAEATQKMALKALTSEPKPKKAVYVKELNIAEVAVMPIRIMPNVYIGVFISGEIFEYERDKEYLNTLEITTPSKVKTQTALNTEYNQKVELSGFQKQCA